SREGDRRQRRGVAAAVEARRRGDRDRDPQVCAAPRRGEARRLRERRDVRFGLRRLRRERRPSSRARGDRDRSAGAAHLRHLGRRGARRRSALRRRDRRLRRASRLTVADRLLELAHTDERAVVYTVVEGPGRGSKLLVLLDREEVVGEGPDELVALAPEIRRNHVFELGEAKIFAEVYGPPPRFVVVGAVDTAEALCALARGIGWHTVCVDARAAFATSERVPSADELVVAWPQDAFERVRLDRDTAVVTLAHDDRFDLPTLIAALRSDCFYVGAIGSRRTQ